MEDSSEVATVTKGVRRLSEFVDAGKVTLQEFGENALLQLMRLSITDCIELVRTLKDRDTQAIAAQMERTCVPTNFRPSGSPFVVNKNDAKAIVDVEDRLEPKYRALYRELTHAERLDAAT